MCHNRYSRPAGTSSAGSRGGTAAMPALPLGTTTPRTYAPNEADAARTFYCDALRGRQVWPTGRADTRGRLWFLVGGTLVEVGPALRSAAAPLELDVDDPFEVAERCWDAGFSVLVNGDGADGAPVSVLDPFGRRIDLTPRDITMSARLAAAR